MNTEKSLFANSIYNVLYKCLNMLFSLVSAAYVSRVLMPEGVGKVSSAQNIATYFTMIASLGIPTYGTKKIAESKGDGELRKSFAELFLINFISSIVCSIIYYVMIYTVPFFEQRQLLLSIVGISIIMNIFNVDWFYQGREEYKYIMLRSLLVKTIALGAIFLFIHTPQDFIIYALIQTLALVLNYIFNIAHIRKYVFWIEKGIDIKRHIKPVLILLASSVAIEIYTLADTTMLAIMCGDIVVGYYAMAMRALNIAKVMVSAVCAVFLPRLSYLYMKGDICGYKTLIRRGFSVIFSLACPMIVLILGLGDEAVLLLFGENYIEAGITLKILSISVLTVSLSAYIGTQILVTLGKEKVIFYSTFAGAVANIFLNLFFIPLFKQNGAAIASVVTEAIVTLLQYGFMKVYIKDIHISWKYKISLVMQCIAMILMIFACSFFDNDIVRLGVGGVLAVLIYVLIGIILKNSCILYLVKRVLGKFIPDTLKHEW